MFSLFLSVSVHAATTPAREPTAPMTSGGTRIKSGFEERVALLGAAGRTMAVVSEASTENDVLTLPTLITSDREGGGPGGTVDATNGTPSSHLVSRSLVSEEGVDSSGSYSSGGEERVKFMLDGRVESYIAGDTMRGYLNNLVNITMANAKNQARKKGEGSRIVLEVMTKNMPALVVHKASRTMAYSPLF